MPSASSIRARAAGVGLDARRLEAWEADWLDPAVGACDEPPHPRRREAVKGRLAAFHINRLSPSGHATGGFIVAETATRALMTLCGFAIS